MIPVILILFCFACGREEINGQADTFSMTLGVNDSDGVIIDSRVVQSYVEIQNHSGIKISVDIEWEITTDDWRPLMEMSIPLEIEPSAIRRAYCPWFEYPGPGFYHVSVEVSSGGKDQEASLIVGVDPEKIPAVPDAAPDFASFWESSLRELAVVDPDFRLERQEREADAKTDLYRVEMQSFGGITVRGWLEIPKQHGRYPALIRVPGYKSVRKPIDIYDDMVVLSFNPRSHGESDDTDEQHLDLWVRGLTSEQNYYYRGAYLDCIRAVDLVMSLEEVDPDRVAIWGGSQGGGFAFATAALDQRIDLCIADIPWLCQWDRFFGITHWPEISDWFAEHPEQNWRSLLHTLSYFDTMNMAERITCPVIMSIGLQDDVCPPATSFATYNLITSPKEYTVYRDVGHWYPEGHKENRFQWLREQFGMEQAH